MTIRPFLPVDSISILVHGKGLSNSAGTRDNIGREEARFATSATLLGQWLNPQIRKCLWVWPNGFKLRGLASARSRSGAHVWEIDRLLVSDQDTECCQLLLEKVSNTGVTSGIKKVFLRLPAESPLIDAARRAGFSPYVNEFLYIRENGDANVDVDGCSEPVSCSVRRKQDSDDFRLFELFSTCIPAVIRQIEGMTYKEWQETRSRTAKKEFVFEEEGKLTGWLRIRTTGAIGQFEIMTTDEERLRQIMGYGMASFNGCRQLFCLAPEFHGELIRQLEGNGFSRVNRYSTFVKELTVRVKETCFVPQGA